MGSGNLNDGQFDLFSLILILKQNIEFQISVRRFASHLQNPSQRDGVGGGGGGDTQQNMFLSRVANKTIEIGLGVFFTPTTPFKIVHVILPPPPRPAILKVFHFQSSCSQLAKLASTPPLNNYYAFVVKPDKISPSWLSVSMFMHLSFGHVSLFPNPLFGPLVTLFLSFAH